MLRVSSLAFVLIVSCAGPGADPDRGPPPGSPPPVGFDPVDDPEDPEEPGEGEGEGVGGEGEGDNPPVDPNERPPLDIAPGVEEPGLHELGTSCPVVTPAEANIAAGAVTAYTFSGSVTGAQGNGQFYVRGRNAEEIAGDIPMEGTSYSINLPVFCGANVVKRAWSNATCTTVLVTALTTSDCVDADLRITTVWDGGGRDWELHLVKPGGRINDNATDCTWTSCIHQQPDWGEVGNALDNPRKDVDWLGSYGPENIWLDGLEPGIYYVMVEHWSSFGAADSDGRVIINMLDKLIVVDINDLAPQHVWIAARIHWPQRTVETSQQIYNCTAEWSGGCRAALPQ
jgi:hypothetical protein